MILKFFNAIFFCFILGGFSAGAQDLKSFQELAQLIQQHQVKSIDELIPKLPLSYRGSYIFVYDSRSAQALQVSPDFPRVILTGEKADFVIAFTKNPGEGLIRQGQDALETMEYKDGRFLMREVVFDGLSVPDASKVQVNPHKCQMCHGQDPRPMWEGYNTWFGVYGSLSRGNTDIVKIGTPEHAKYLSFLQTGRQAPRYQDLPAEKPTKSGPDGAVNIANANSTHPNSQLSQIFLEQNMYRVKRLFEASPQIESFKYAIIATAQNCFPADADFLSLFPEKVDQIATPLVEEAQIIKERELFDFNARKERFFINNGELDSSTYTPVYVASDRLERWYYLAKRMSVNYHYWSTHRDLGMYYFGGPQTGFDLYTPIIKTGLSGSFAEWSLSCDELKRLSLKALQDLKTE